MSEKISVTATRDGKYRFLVDFGPGIVKTVADEPAPLGEGAASPALHIFFQAPLLV